MVEKSFLKIQGSFLVKIRDNTFNGIIEENAVEHIEIFLKVVKPLKIKRARHDRFRLSVFPISLAGDASEWFKKDCIGSVTTWDDLVEKTYEEHEYELNNNMKRDLEEPWSDNGVPYQLNYGANDVGDTQDSQEHKKEHHDPSICRVRRFEMMKYSFDADDKREEEAGSMEWSLSGNALKTFGRSITCLARIGNELTLQASPQQLALHALNSSRSAYQSITLKPAFFDTYTITGAQVQCSVLLKAVCSVLRTPLTSINHLTVILTDPDASKVQWTLDCYNGMKKSYWITCNVEADSTLQEITVIATDPTLLPPDAAADKVGGKAVELRSYIDPTKENDSSLHTQLWIDPCEEFVQYTHTGDPVDVTFGVKELKAFLSFCEGCEVDIHLYFEKAGEPILMAPKFGLEDVSVSNFDATLVLATMLVSQLHDRTTSTEPIHAAHGTEDQVQERPKGNVSQHPSDHTRIWSELSASAAKSATGTSGRARRERDLNTNEHVDIQRISTINISNAGEERRKFQNNTHQPMQTEHVEEPQDGAEINAQGVVSQRHHSNWVDADEDDDEGGDSEPFVQATPPYCEE
uniref:Cell cycle checkpoint control protein RAD9A isoform X1 n=1 Tax=Tanacetum cinerariifolium TaxID=118510 RepID=A0A6L2JNP5_TANCI|nr:cell cycle checkpoint control protein RAD9A isoform X1 [Tanacetum cinerariifolium]